jgi:hypothetical protein
MPNVGGRHRSGRVHPPKAENKELGASSGRVSRLEGPITRRRRSSRGAESRSKRLSILSPGRKRPRAPRGDSLQTQQNLTSSSAISFTPGQRTAGLPGSRISTRLRSVIFDPPGRTLLSPRARSKVDSAFGKSLQCCCAQPPWLACLGLRRGLPRWLIGGSQYAGIRRLLLRRRIRLRRRHRSWGRLRKQ